MARSQTQLHLVGNKEPLASYSLNGVIPISVRRYEYRQNAMTLDKDGFI